MQNVPLVAHVARRVCRTGIVDRVIVATDHGSIAEAVVRWCPEVEIQRVDGPRRSGSDRVAAAVADLPAARIVNVQGDEALVDAADLRGALRGLERAPVGTVASPAGPADDLSDPDVVKVRVDGRGLALDFTREAPRAAAPTPLIHRGIYSFTRASLQRFAGLPTCGPERCERLEQLRLVEAGIPIAVEQTRGAAGAVNRPRDVPRVEALLRSTRQVA